MSKFLIAAAAAFLVLSFAMPDGAIGPASAKITPVKENNGGQTPKGEANGVPSENQNPAGKAPAGQNK